jgi:multiple sugar transport system ATP-binding protein
MAELSLDHVSKIFPGNVCALRDVSFTVGDGELVVLVGPSGSGKTTILRVIAGLESATSGNISIQSRIINDVPARDRDVAMVFQRHTLYPHLSVRQNLAFGLELRETGWLKRLTKSRQAAAEIDQRVAEAARLLELEDVLDRKPAQLSGGQQQRVALGRAVVRRPAVFLLDEPLSHLDVRLRSALRRQLHLLHRRFPATMIYVTHDPAEAMILADRVVVLQDGRVEQGGRPLDVYQRPANRFVAGFFGWPSMNLVDGRLTHDQSRLRLCMIGQSWLVPDSLTPSWQGHADKPLTLGIRPNDLRLGMKLDPTEFTLPMQVLLIEPLGNASLIVLERDGMQLTVQLDGQTQVAERQTIEVVCDMNRIHLFDAATGLTLTNGRPEG